MDTLVVAVRVFISLAVVLGLLWFLHRKLSVGVRTRGAGNPIKVSGRQNFGQKASVVVVDLDGQRFLLGVTDHSINVLHTGEIPPVAETEFARVLAAEAARPAVRNALPKGMIGAGGFGPASFGPAVGRASSFRSSFFAPSILSGSAFSGSVLSPGTWKQAAAVLRRSR